MSHVRLPGTLNGMLLATTAADDSPTETRRAEDLAEEACTLPALRAVKDGLAVLVDPETTPELREAVGAACGRLLGSAIANVEMLAGEAETAAALLYDNPALKNFAKALHNELAVTTGAGWPTGFMANAPRHLLACLECGERLYTEQEIQIGQDADGDPIATSPYHWQCGACGGWNARK